MVGCIFASRGQSSGLSDSHSWMIDMHDTHDFYVLDQVIGIRCMSVV